MNNLSRHSMDSVRLDPEEEPPGIPLTGGADLLAPSAPPASLPRTPPRLATKPSPRRLLRMNSGSRRLRRAFFPDATDREWSDWQWQLRHRFLQHDALRRVLRLSVAEDKALELSNGMLPLAVTPHYMGLVAPRDPEQAIRRAVIPTVYERNRGAGEADDPLGEEAQSPVPGLVHRYADRVLLLATDGCSTYCRYCTRSRVVGHGALAPSVSRLRAAFDYIARTPAVRDVLISGGDPLTLDDERLEWILKNLRAIKHVEIVRIGTKAPTALPQRITPRLVRMLRKYHPLWMSLHFMHPDECCYETERACGLLADGGIPLGSQTVLLRGINDSVEVMGRLMRALMKLRVRPYYIYQCDPITGSAHFRTSVSTGLEILRGLRGHTSGYAVPTFVIDAPGGGGKIPVAPDYLAGRDGQDLLLRNYEGRLFRYPDCVRG